MANINHRIIVKSLKQSMLLLHMRVNITTKVKTHYETLGISPGATYNEIKSAYYDLTLKYHPDRNKSESAKTLFQEISNAYDVLSKYDTRKQYDRTIIIKYGDLSSQQTKKHKSKTTVQSSKPLSDLYNFDEWLKQHYSESLKTKFRLKEEVTYFQTYFKNDSNITRADIIFFIVAVTSFVTVGYIYQTIKESK